MSFKNHDYASVINNELNNDKGHAQEQVKNARHSAILKNSDTHSAKQKQATESVSRDHLSEQEWMEIQKKIRHPLAETLQINQQAAYRSLGLEWDRKSKSFVFKQDMGFRQVRVGTVVEVHNITAVLDVQGHEILVALNDLMV